MIRWCKTAVRPSWFYGAMALFSIWVCVTLINRL